MHSSSRQSVPPDSPLVVYAGAAVGLFSDILYGGGVERIVSYTSRALFSRSGGTLVLFADDRIDFDYAGTIRSLGLSPPPYRGILQEVIIVLSAAVRVRRIKREQGLKVLISFKEAPNLANVLSHGCKSVITVREVKSAGVKYSGAKGLLVRKILGLVYRRADLVVAISEAVAADLVDNFAIPKRLVRVVYNPCDTEMVRALAAQPLSVSHQELFSEPVVLAVGRLEHPKGHWHLIRAFREIRKTVPRARLVVLGEGNLRSMLVRLAHEAGLGDSVHFLGFQKNPFQFMRRAQVFVLSSLWEGFGNVLLEAMSCGVPIVAASCPGGCREILGGAGDLDMAGVLTESLDGEYRGAAEALTSAERGLADAVTSLLLDEKKRRALSAAGHARVEEFSVDSYIKRWEEVLAELK